MGVHDETRIGMGGALFGIGFAGTLARLIYASEVSRSDKGGSAWGETWYMAFFAFTIFVALVGVYFLATVWSGLPTGSTAIERAFQPRLRARLERVARAEGRDAVALARILIRQDVERARGRAQERARPALMGV